MRKIKYPVRYLSTVQSVSDDQRAEAPSRILRGHDRAEHREFALALVERANKATRARIDAELAFEEIQRLKVRQDRGWSPTGSFRDET